MVMVLSHLHEGSIGSSCLYHLCPFQPLIKIYHPEELTHHVSFLLRIKCLFFYLYISFKWMHNALVQLENPVNTAYCIFYLGKIFKHPMLTYYIENSFLCIPCCVNSVSLLNFHVI